MEVGEEGDHIPVATLSPLEKDSCITMGSDESHFNISLTVKDNHNEECSQNNRLEEKGEP